MSGDDVTGLDLVVEEDGLLGEEFWDAFPGDVARDVAETGWSWWESFISEFLSLFFDLFLKVVEA